MPVTLRRLLAEADLGLRPLVPVSSAFDAPLTWAAVSELPDPTPWLAGGELLLTTGVSWRPGSDDAARLVERLVTVPVGAIGLALDVVHAAAPACLVEAAQRAGLPLVGVPLEVPFITISQRLAGWVLDAEHASTLAQLAMHQTLADALLDGEGLTSIVRRLRGMVGEPVAVLDHQGRVLAAEPWGSGRVPGRVREQVRVGGAVVAEVVTPGGVDAALLRTAARLVGLELARVQAVRAGRRELAGQVLSDVMARVLPDDEAARRLKPYGVPVHGLLRVALASVDVGPQRLRTVPWSSDAFLPEHRDGLLCAVVDGTVVLVLAADVPVEDLAHGAHAYLRGLGGTVSLGVSGLHEGISGLRLAWHEAQRLLAQGAGIHVAAPANLVATLVADAGAALRDRALELLGPVLDRDRDGVLLETLRTYLECDCSPSAATERLFVHRNTLRYRIHLVEQLTGLDLARFTDRMDAWVAVRALGEAQAE